jgi:lipopolysaccharide/colanic/teichoic acid biosynthesis glycosyltransferase
VSFDNYNKAKERIKKLAEYAPGLTVGWQPIQGFRVLKNIERTKDTATFYVLSPYMSFEDLDIWLSGAECLLNLLSEYTEPIK